MIEYDKYRYGDYEKVTMEVDGWLRENLKNGGIESRLEKATNLLSIVGAQYLEEYPDKLDDIVRAVDCEGYNHKLS